MAPKPRRLSEAATRKGMRIISVALPEAMHRALALARVRDRVAMSEAIRQAVKLWLSRRKTARKRGKP